MKRCQWLLLFAVVATLASGIPTSLKAYPSGIVTVVLQDGTTLSGTIVHVESGVLTLKSFGQVPQQDISLNGIKKVIDFNGNSYTAAELQIDQQDVSGGNDYFKHHHNYFAENKDETSDVAGVQLQDPFIWGKGLDFSVAPYMNFGGLTGNNASSTNLFRQLSGTNGSQPTILMTVGMKAMVGLGPRWAVGGFIEDYLFNPGSSYDFSSTYGAGYDYVGTDGYYDYYTYDPGTTIDNVVAFQSSAISYGGFLRYYFQDRTTDIRSPLAKAYIELGLGTIQVNGAYGTEDAEIPSDDTFTTTGSTMVEKLSVGVSGVFLPSATVSEIGNHFSFYWDLAAGFQYGVVNQLDFQNNPANANGSSASGVLRTANGRPVIADFSGVYFSYAIGLAFK